MSSNSLWLRFVSALPMRGALAAVAAVWGLGCVWSFSEQTNFAADLGFVFPHLLPLVIDGLAASLAFVAWAASLDARPAVPARLGTFIAVAASSASNGVWAQMRTGHLIAVIVAVGIPVAANLAFEVLLAEMRRQVQRGRGLPPPVAIPYPRLIRLVLAPWPAFTEWRRQVLELTAPTTAAKDVAATDTLTSDEGAVSVRPADTQVVAEVVKPTSTSQVETGPDTAPMAIAGGELPRPDITSRPVTKTAPRPKVAKKRGPKVKVPDQDWLFEQVRQMCAEAEANGQPVPGRDTVAGALGISSYYARVALEAAKQSTNGHKPTGEIQ